MRDYMAYKIEKIKAVDIPNYINNKISFWAKPELLNLFAKRDNTELFYIIVTQNDTILSIMPILEKKKYRFVYINQAHEQYYTPIDFLLPDNQTLFSLQYEKLAILKLFAKYLKNNYFKVVINFEDNISDIRAFSWVGFTVTPLYVYKKNIINYSEEYLAPSVKPELKKAYKNGLTAKQYWDIKSCSNLLQSLSNRKNRPKRQTENDYQLFLNDLYKNSLCDMVLVCKDDTPLTFAIVLKDKVSLTLYSFVTATSDLGLKLNSGIFCFNYILSNYREYSIFDLGGANIENVAFFKSKFNCELKNYYRVEINKIPLLKNK